MYNKNRKMKKKKHVRQLTCTQHQLPIFYTLFEFVVKLKFLREASNFFLLRVTLTSYMALVFKKKSNKFCVQAAKIIKLTRAFQTVVLK